MGEGYDNPASHLRLAVENDEKSASIERNRWRYRQPLRQLTANLMRVTRGAGRPHEVIEDLGTAMNGFREFYERCGVLPSGEDISAALSLSKPHHVQLSPSAEEWESGIRRMVRGSLQIAASTLLDQNTQRAAGEHELFGGLEILEEIRAENRAKRLAAERVLRKPREKKQTKVRRPK